MTQYSANDLDDTFIQAPHVLNPPPPFRPSHDHLHLDSASASRVLSTVVDWRLTDGDKSMSAVDLDGQRVYITEAEADALTVAGAVDGRRHLKVTDSDSVI